MDLCEGISQGEGDGGGEEEVRDGLQGTLIEQETCLDDFVAKGQTKNLNICRTCNACLC